MVAMRYENPELRDRLAAEYALGTLRGPARRRFQRLMAEDALLRDLVTSWELRLNDMAAMARPVTPRPQLWESIERALGPTPRARHERPGLFARLWESLGFWRGAAFGAMAVAAALVLFVAVGQAPQPTETRYIAVLLDETATPVLVASLIAEDGRLAIRSVKAVAVESGKALELWMLPPEGAAPRSLGLIEGMQALVKLTDSDAADLAAGALAVSLEPAGGSTTGAPTGPVLFSGAILPAAEFREP
jgi:anti-sigma-K factor RskA